jgi:hypothetical protein
MTKTAKKVSPKTAKSAKRAPKAGVSVGVAEGLRRKVYEALPAASWSMVQQIEAGETFAQILDHFANKTNSGVDSRGAARAMQQACTETGLRSWCYEFGNPHQFTHMVLLVEEGDKIWLHDPYLDLSSNQDFLSLLDQLDAGQSISLLESADKRLYLADPKLEDELARKWLKISAKDKRGRMLQVRGGLSLLENTQPAYRDQLTISGARGLADLLRKPIALLNPDGLQDDVRFLAERLGLLEPKRKRANAKEAHTLVSIRNEEAIEIARAAQQQLAGMLDQLNKERANLGEQLVDLRVRHTDTLVELAALRESSRAELMRAAQARMTAEAEATQITARLNQMKAEIDDALAEGLRIQEALNHSEGEKRSLLLALDASEAERQQLVVERARVEAEARARADEHQVALKAGPRSLLSALSIGAAASVRDDGSFGVRGRRGGCVCYGPYLDLTAGSYRLELDFERPSLAGILPAKAIIEVVDDQRYLYSSRVKLGGGRSRISATFDVPAAQQPRQVEFRVLVGRNSFAVLRDLRLETRG